MPTLPDPPADYSDAERRAWRAGATTALRLIGSQAHVLAGHLEDTQPADAEQADDTCPECGAELIEGFGGNQCPSCGDTN